MLTFALFIKEFLSMFKKISLLSVSAICLCGLNVALADTNSVSMNSDSGPYFGVQLGGTWTPYEFDPIHDLVYSKMDDSGFAGHANVGYVFNKYFGLEVGEQYVPKITNPAILEKVSEKTMWIWH
jgi:hypothetical protein